jgi:hypothetical protein
VQRIFALVNAPESQVADKLGGVTAMDELLDVSSAEAETKVSLSFSLEERGCRETDGMARMHVLQETDVCVCLLSIDG